MLSSWKIIFRELFKTMTFKFPSLQWTEQGYTSKCVQTKSELWWNHLPGTLNIRNTKQCTLMVWITLLAMVAIMIHC